MSSMDASDVTFQPSNPTTFTHVVYLDRIYEIGPDNRLVPLDKGPVEIMAGVTLEIVDEEQS